MSDKIENAARADGTNESAHDRGTLRERAGAGQISAYRSVELTVDEIALLRQDISDDNIMWEELGGRLSATEARLRSALQRMQIERAISITAGAIQRSTSLETRREAGLPAVMVWPISATPGHLRRPVAEVLEFDCHTLFIAEMPPEYRPDDARRVPADMLSGRWIQHPELRGWHLVLF